MQRSFWVPFLFSCLLALTYFLVTYKPTISLPKIDLPKQINDLTEKIHEENTVKIGTTTPSTPQPTNKVKNTVTKAMAEKTTNPTPPPIQNIYANGEVPLGDEHYVTDAPKRGYIYLCNAHKDAQRGAEVSGPWIGTMTWNYLNKPAVSGNVLWENAFFSNTVSGIERILSGNGLPNHHTGIFPITPTDPVSKYDRNPNTITTQLIKREIPLNPTYSKTPYCMGMEVGVMLTGVPLFNGFDAELRDAPAHELQDSCDGHPQMNGEYHYHSMSSCLKDISISTVLGYALDGFPITGPLLPSNTYLTTDDLDECHGMTSDVLVDGKVKNTYHYVMTQDFPYSVSCFHAKPVSLFLIAPPQPTLNNSTPAQTNNNPHTENPPQEALNACTNKDLGNSCNFTTPRGESISGTCRNPNNGALACVPS